MLNVLATTKTRPCSPVLLVGIWQFLWPWWQTLLWGHTVLISNAKQTGYTQTFQKINNINIFTGKNAAAEMWLTSFWGITTCVIPLKSRRITNSSCLLRKKLFTKISHDKNHQFKTLTERSSKSPTEFWNWDNQPKGHINPATATHKLHNLTNFFQMWFS